MDNIDKIKKEKEFYNNIINSCWSDESFKNRFIENPKATIEEYTGQNFIHPENKKLVVEDQTNSEHIYLNIPSKPNLDDIELSEKDLEMVAGGFLWPALPIILAISEIARGMTDGGMGRPKK